MSRYFNSKSLSVAVSALVLSTSVNAVVLNTLNGVDYEWLELTATQGMSRNQVEIQILDTSSFLYGYRYASTMEVESLFNSYVAYDGIDGSRGSSNVVAQVNSLLNDFGSLRSGAESGVVNTVDVGTLIYGGFSSTSGMYGTNGECDGELPMSCVALISTLTDIDMNPLSVAIVGVWGWDSTAEPKPKREFDISTSVTGSFLVKASVVPIPAAVWLFGSGLIGLIGVARRKAHS